MEIHLTGIEERVDRCAVRAQVVEKSHDFWMNGSDNDLMCW